MFIGNETYNNIATTSFTIKNKSKSAILPSDFYKPFRFEVDPGWKIISIEKLYGTFGLDFNWVKISDNIAECEPLLLNPGDRITQDVYLSNVHNDTTRESYVIEGIKPKVSVRISGLRRLTHVDPYETLGLGKDFKYPIVHLELPNIIFVVSLSSALSFWFFIMLCRIKIFNLNKFIVSSLLVVVSILCFATSEALETIIYGPYPLRGWKIDNIPLTYGLWLNWLILSIYGMASLVVIALNFRGISFKNKTSDKL